MPVTVLQRPEGQVLIPTVKTGSISSSYGTGDASVYTVSPHGLSDGDYIYLISDIEDYNGFWYIDSTGTYTFKIKHYSDSDFIQYIQDAEVNYYESIYSHGWSAVHLPITYRLSSDLYPTNSVDTTRNISSTVDTNGYTLLNLSGTLGTIHAFDFVEITTPNDDLSGIYQIVEWISSTVIIINLEYDSANNFTSATIQKYYNNYNILVRVYAGINASHEWASEKPFELAATLELIPDENGEVFFSVNEILKSYIETRNNTLLGTLPNNIDFWTNFYIEYAEAYDDSDGYALGTYTGNFTSDQSTFEGTAVNAKLAFKNIQSGYMSDYLMNNTTAKFLTLFTIPVLFGCSDDAPDCYQDISFLKPTDAPLVLKKQFYSSGNPGDLVETNISGDQGVYRIPIEANCNYDRVDVSLVLADISQTSANFYSESVQDPGGIDWTENISGKPEVDLNSSQISKEVGFNNIYFKANTLYEVTVLIGRINIGGTGTSQVNIRFYKGYSGGDFVDEVDNYNYVWSGTLHSFSITLPEDASYISYEVVRATGTGTYTFDLIQTNVFFQGGEVMSETKEFKIDCGCSKQELTLTWLNNLGGFDYWAFKAEKDLLVEIRETGETRKNIFPQWPKSYGANADTIRRQTYRVSNKGYTIRSQYVTRAEVDAIAYIKSSVLVQIINSRQDRRTVIMDSDSFVVYPEGSDLYSIIFNVSFTDDIPSQTV